MTTEWHGPTSEGKSWFSDEALRKQAEVERLRVAGKKVPLDLMCGIWEPRVQPTEGERCNCCGNDGRDEVGGEVHNDKRWCVICLGREHHIE